MVQFLYHSTRVFKLNYHMCQKNSPIKDSLEMEFTGPRSSHTFVRKIYRKMHVLRYLSSHILTLNDSNLDSKYFYALFPDLFDDNNNNEYYTYSQFNQLEHNVTNFFTLCYDIHSLKNKIDLFNPLLNSINCKFSAFAFV